jgi:hypothetical protein
MISASPLHRRSKIPAYAQGANSRNSVYYAACLTASINVGSLLSAFELNGPSSFLIADAVERRA